MTEDDARKVLIEAYCFLPDLPEEHRELLARLIAPTTKRKRWWHRK